MPSDSLEEKERNKQLEKEKGGGGRMQRRSYPSDLTDQEWKILEPLIPSAKPGGHPVYTGAPPTCAKCSTPFCTWTALEVNGGPCRTIFHPGRRCGANPRTWRNDGTWKRIHTALREKTRVNQGREPTPSAAIIDSQSVKTSQKGGSAATMAAHA
jgi:putative transposase